MTSIWSTSVTAFVSYPANSMTDRQTDRQTYSNDHITRQPWQSNDVSKSTISKNKERDLTIIGIILGDMKGTITPTFYSRGSSLFSYLTLKPYWFCLGL